MGKILGTESIKHMRKVAEETDSAVTGEPSMN